MTQRRVVSSAALTVLIAGIPTFGQSATLRLVASQSAIDSGRQVTIEAFISNLSVELRGYEIGLDITGGASGQITAAQFEGSVDVDQSRADWAFREVSDAGVSIISAGDQRFPPRLVALIAVPEIGAFPQNLRYLGTFVLEASADASGNFQVGITPPDVADSGAGTILITVGGGSFPADVDDPSVIPVESNPFMMRVRNVGPTCIDGDSDGYGFPGDASCPNGSEEDCDDGDALIHPGADELCDGLDNDCNGVVDDSPNCVIPAVSEWGLSVLVLLVLTAGTVLLGRPRRSQVC